MIALLLPNPLFRFIDLIVRRRQQGKTHYEEISHEIDRCYKINSSTTAREVASRLAPRGIRVSEAYIKRIRAKLGYENKTTKYCHTIRDVNKEKRVLFCEEMLHAGTTFSDCVFTDECTIQGFGRLVQDNAPAHVSLYTKRKMEEWQMETLDWPAESPDLNPIELIWGNMKASIRKREVRNLNDLKVAIIQYWKTLTPQICSNYISGIKKKMERVIEQGGRNIRESR
ncbi:hypothetical protein RB195_016207 [Necator americanus]|uniref:Tc1-like transposase DDE domain-containing protein n=1 Tax=Necator americanus TaxID=51031 RepID=A0ABR1E936_NECAM